MVFFVPRNSTQCACLQQHCGSIFRSTVFSVWCIMFSSFSLSGHGCVALSAGSSDVALFCLCRVAKGRKNAERNWVSTKTPKIYFGHSAFWFYESYWGFLSVGLWCRALWVPQLRRCVLQRPSVPPFKTLNLTLISLFPPASLTWLLSISNTWNYIMYTMYHWLYLWIYTNNNMLVNVQSTV
jgi:hypothetical protein